MDQLSSEELMPILPTHGIPRAISDRRSTYQRRLAKYLILASILFERAAFYSLVSNLVVNLDSDDLLNWKSSNSSLAAFLFSGTTYISTLVFAIFSDAKLRRATTILGGFILYLIGYILAILVTNPSINLCARNVSSEASIPNTNRIIDEPCVGWILATLVIIGLGAGAVQSNMAVFGAEQIQKLKMTSPYFDNYMIVVNVGGMIGLLIISFIQIDTQSYFIGYIAAAVMLLISITLFGIGHLYYIHVEPHDTVIATCIPIVLSAFRVWLQTRRQTIPVNHVENNRYSRHSSTSSDDPSSVNYSKRVNTEPSEPFDLSTAVRSGRFTDRMVDDVKSLKRAIIVFGFLIPYFLIYNQINATFPLQGEHMHKPASIKNIGTLMSLSDPATIFVGLLILKMYRYKYGDVEHSASTIRTKFVAGMCVAVVTMCISGTLEIVRRAHCDSKTDESSVSIYFLLIQNISMGISELFAMVASYEYAYFAAPRSAQSLFMSLRFVSLGVSSFIGSAFISLFPTATFHLDFSCRKEEKMNWSFYTYFYILAGLQLIVLIIFHFCEKKYQIIKINRQQTEQY